MDHLFFFYNHLNILTDCFNNCVFWNSMEMTFTHQGHHWFKHIMALGMTVQTSPESLEQLFLGVAMKQLAGVSQNHTVTEDARAPTIQDHLWHYKCSWLGDSKIYAVLVGTCLERCKHLTSALCHNIEQHCAAIASRWLSHSCFLKSIELHISWKLGSYLVFYLR